MSDNRLGSRAQRWWNAHAEYIRRDSAFHAFVGAYSLAGMITGMAARVPAKFIPFTYAYYSVPLAVLAISIGGGLWALCTRTPFAALRSAAARLARPEGVAASLLYVSLSIHMGVFTSIKTMLPDIHPFYADRALADMSEWLHGELVWRYTEALLPPWFTATVCSVYFGLWGVLLASALLACVFAPQVRELRAQFLWTYLLMWPLLGNIVAGAAMSAGPIYYGLVTGDQARFAPMLNYLAHCPPLMAGAADLWNSHLTGHATVAAGISAFPSMHLATTTLFVLMVRRIYPNLTWIGVAFLTVILISSVHLGWHYAIDGYFAIGATVALWAAVGRLLRQRPRFAAAHVEAPLTVGLLAPSAVAGYIHQSLRKVMVRAMNQALRPTLALCAMLTSCSTSIGTASLPEARCHAAGGAAELGQPLTDRTKELARMGAGAVRSQVQPYGMPLQQRDSDPQRLNIEVDKDQVIQRLRCG